MPPIGSVSTLTDEELRETLKGYGVNVGPVVASTRKIYEKKLHKLIASGGLSAPAEPEPEEEEDEEEEEEEEDEEVEEEEVQIRRPAPTPTRAAPTPTPTRTYTPTAAPTNRTPIIQPRKASPTRASTVTRRNVQSTTASSGGTVDSSRSGSVKKSGGMSMWIKLFFIIAVAFLVYLVIINMNPAAENKIPAALDSQTSDDV